MPLLTNSLSQYLEEIGNRWIKRRQQVLEPIWNRNLMMINGEDPFPEWKKNDGGTVPGHEWRSDLVVNIVRPKVYSVFSMLLDILLPDGDIPFSLDLADADLQGLPMEERIFEEDAKNKMRAQIQKQLRERRSDREFTKKLLSLLYYAMAWSKYNVRTIETKGFIKEGTEQGNVPYISEVFNPGKWKKIKESNDIPGHDWRSVWSIYWDMESEPDHLENGKGVFERDLISAYDLRQKKKGYISAAIEKVLVDWQSEQIPDTLSTQPGLREVTDRVRRFDNREYWIRVPRRLADEFEENELELIKKGEEVPIFMEYDGEERGDDVFILAETANGEIIKFKRRKDKYLPYKMCLWEWNLDQQDRPGTCPPDNLVHIQRLYTGLVRAFVDNKKLSANVIAAVKRRLLQDPSQLDGGLSPGTILDVEDSCSDARQAISQVIIQDVGESLVSGIGLADRWKDMVSMIPELMQGFVLPKHKPDTAYETGQLLEQAGKYVGQAIRNIDEFFIEPEINDLYERIMLDDNFDAQGKGNFRCIPGGFINFKNRVIHIQQLEKVLMLALSSEVLGAETKIRPILEEIYRNMELDPEKFLKTDDEKKAEAEMKMKMEQDARAKAFQDLIAQTEIETQAKIMELEAKGRIDSGKDEDNFQRDVVKQVGNQRGGT